MYVRVCVCVVLAQVHIDQRVVRRRRQKTVAQQPAQTGWSPTTADAPATTSQAAA